MWTTEMTFDSDRTDVGTATAVWTAEGEETFSYSRRLSVDEFEAFSREAIVALDEHRTKLATQADLTKTLAETITAVEAVVADEKRIALEEAEKAEPVKEEPIKGEPIEVSPVDFAPIREP